MSILISIIVPCYNQAQYLSEALKSVYDQTYINWECIIVNDGSPDHTEEVAKIWLDKDKRFRYLYHQNQGVSASRNYGIENANGDWILPLDADDKIGKKYLELAVIKINEGYNFIYSIGEYFEDRSGEMVLKSFDLKQLLLKNQIFNSAFFEKSNFNTVGGYDCNMIYGFEDWEFYIALLNNTQNNVIKLDYVGCYYRIKQNSRNATILSDIQRMKEIEQYIFKKHLKFYVKYFPNIIDVLTFYENNIYKSLFAKFIEVFKYKIITWIKF
jgi:glycosyltransferase involved in cell wall biosynthesis